MPRRILEQSTGWLDRQPHHAFFSITSSSRAEILKNVALGVSMVRSMRQLSTGRNSYSRVDCGNRHMSNRATFKERFRRPRRSGKFLAGLGLGCGLICVLCCGGLIVAGFMFRRMANEAMIDDPDQIRAATVEICDIEIPPQFTPKLLVDAKIPFVDRRVMTVVTYQGVDEEQVVVISEFDAANFDQKDRKTMDANVKEQLDDAVPESGDLNVQESEKVELVVHGQPATFTINRGAVEGSEVERWAVNGAFEGQRGPAILVLAAKVDQITQEEIKAMLNSMADDESAQSATLEEPLQTERPLELQTVEPDDQTAP